MSLIQIARETIAFFIETQNQYKVLQFYKWLALKLILFVFHEWGQNVSNNLCPNQLQMSTELKWDILSLACFFHHKNRFHGLSFSVI